MYYEFTDDLKTGNTTIDSEHRTLIKAANDALQAIKQGKGIQELESTVAFLASYTKTHFGNEGSLQDKYEYPDRRRHKLWHESYIRDIELTYSRLQKEGTSPVLVSELERRIVILISHIKEQDTKVAAHIQMCIDNNHS